MNDSGSKNASLDKFCSRKYIKYSVLLNYLKVCQRELTSNNDAEEISNQVTYISCTCIAFPLINQHVEPKRNKSCTCNIFAVNL